MRIVVVVALLKWNLMVVTVIPSSVLAWKILRRKHLHSVFNLSMCFYFFWCSVFSPLLLYEYGNLLEGLVQQTVSRNQDLCDRILIYRCLIIQANKVFLINIVFRWSKIN